MGRLEDNSAQENLDQTVGYLLSIGKLAYDPDRYSIIRAEHTNHFGFFTINLTVINKITGREVWEFYTSRTNFESYLKGRKGVKETN